MRETERQRELRLWLIAGGLLYPGWAVVLAAAAPGTDPYAVGRVVLGVLCLVLAGLSHTGRVTTARLSVAFTGLASAVALHAVATAVGNAFHPYYLVAASIVVLAISLVLDTYRYIVFSYAAVAIGSLALIGLPDTHEQAFFLCTVLTAQTVGFVAISTKLRLVRSLRRSATDLARMRTQLSETAILAKIGGWTYYAATGRMRWTEETFRLLGIAPDAAATRPWERFLERVRGDDRDVLAAALAAALKGGGAFDLELDIVAMDGRAFRARLLGVPVHDAGELVAVRGSLQDTSDRHRLESELQRRETHLRALLDATPGLISWVDADLRYLGVNGNLARVFGLSPEAFVGKELGWLNPAGSGDTQRIFREAFASASGTVSREVATTMPGGDTTTFLMNVRVFDDGRAAVCVGMDITALKRTKRELEEQRDLLAKITDHLPLGLFVKDARESYRFVAWNRYMELKTGVPRDLVIGRTDYDLFSKEDADRFRSVDEWVMGEDGPLEIAEEEVATPDGKLPVRTRKVPVRSREHALLLGVLEDITDEKIRDTLITEQRAKLVHASRMSTLGEMSGGIAHEINNPLTVIQGFADILQATAAETELKVEDVTHAAGRIRDMCDRIAKIVKGLRAFSRDASHDPFELVSVERVVKDSLELCQQRLLHHGVALEVGHLETVEVDCRPVQVSQVLLNLLHNAFDALQKADERWVRVETRLNGPWVEIEVVDAGHGIPENVAAKMMQPFFTTKPPGQGTGLGLSISKGIVETHGGQLLYDTVDGHTRFRVRLPLRQTSEQAA